MTSLPFPDLINCSPKENYTQIPNDLLRDKNLSYRARGVLCRLLSNKNEIWHTYITKLKEESPEGTTAIQSAIEELMAHGYFIPLVIRDKEKNKVRQGFMAYSASPFNFDFMTGQIQELDKQGYIVDLPPRLKALASKEELEQELKNEGLLLEKLNTGELKSAPMTLRILIKIISRKKTSFSKEKEETFSRSAEATQEKEKSFSNSSPVGASSPDDFSEIKIVKRKRNSASAVSQQSAEKDKKKDTPVIPERIRPLFDYWKSLGLHVPRENTKSYAECIASLRKFELGKIFKGLYDNGHVRCYTFNEWKTAVDNFHSALTDTDVYPVDKTKISSMTINKFLYDPFSQARHGKSNFLHYLHNEPEYIRKPRLDLHPSVTNIIQDGFKKHVLGNGVNVKLPVDSINAFISTSDKIHKFYEDNKTLLIGDVGLKWTPTTLASRFWDMVLQNTKDISQMKAYYLSSDKMILELARYLKQNGYLKEKISYKL